MQDTDLSDIHRLGNQTRARVVRAQTGDTREWLADAPVCPALRKHRIAHVGLMDAAEPFRVVRTDLSGTFFLACSAGEGNVLVDGRWKTIGAGTACLQPPFILNALHAVTGSRWAFCWVRYDQPRGQRPAIDAHAPVLGRFDTAPIAAAVGGLCAEAGGAANAAAEHHWVELIHGYVQRFAHPWRGDDRLWRVWDAVQKDVAAAWTLDALAAIACVSPEHLRRLSRQCLGRSPMQHVTFLRMRRAAELLATSGDKVETVAHAVGYQNPFVFSNLFKKWIGRRPSEHRRER